jgi:hypothetical protein
MALNRRTQKAIHDRYDAGTPDDEIAVELRLPLHKVRRCTERLECYRLGLYDSKWDVVEHFVRQLSEEEIRDRAAVLKRRSLARGTGGGGADGTPGIREIRL